MSIVMHKIAIGLAALTIATACSTLSASALPGGGNLGFAKSGGDDFTTVGFGRGGFGFRGGFAGLDSVMALASIVDSDPAPSPSTAVSDLGLDSVVASPFTVDSIAGLHSVDLVVDGNIARSTQTGDRQQDASVAGVRLEVSRYLGPAQ